MVREQHVASRPRNNVLAGQGSRSSGQRAALHQFCDVPGGGLRLQPSRRAEQASDGAGA